MTPTGKVKGVHLVGSIPVDNEEHAFRLACRHLSSHVRRLPDGETQERWNFAEWQTGIFQHEPRVLNDVFRKEPAPYTEDQEDDILSSFQNIETHYEERALNSYETFKKLRNEGVIPDGVRFQVSLPSPVTVVNLFVRPALRSKVELLYQRAMLETLTRIQEGIPARDLAIQWDCVAEIMMLEGEPTMFNFSAWFDPVFDGIVKRLAFLTASVEKQVEVGLHLCYGDAGNKHFLEPQDLGTAVALSNGVTERANRNIDWIHMPVPKDRKDRAYFEPLEKLKIDSKTTDVVLGLVHYDDLDGTEARIERASEFLERFLVATECGMGRTPREQLDDVLSTCAKVCESSS